MSVIEDDLLTTQASKTERGEILELLNNDENFKKKSLISTYNQAYAFATLYSIAEENDITFLKNWLKNISDFNISIDAQGRKDMVTIGKGRNDDENFAQKFLDKFRR